MRDYTTIHALLKLAPSIMANCGCDMCKWFRITETINEEKAEGIPDMFVELF